jgi:HK97 family phage prohead protease
MANRSRDYDVLDFKFELKELTDAGELDGYAAVFGNVDQGGDVIEPGAFSKSIQETGGKVPILWQHDRYEPIGVSSSLEQDRKGLRVKGQLNMDVQRGREARSLLGQGAMQGLSVGYKSVKHAFDGPVRRLKEMALKEFSPVVFPMNELATVQVKAAGGTFPLASRDRAWDAAAAVQRVREKTGAADEPNAAYARCFFWHAAGGDTDRDDGLPDDFGSYKLLFVDVVDGELQAIPRAIFACAVVVEGGRGGIDIPAGDLVDVKDRIAAYYARMAREFYDHTLHAPWVSGKQDFTDLESLMSFVTEVKEGRMFSAANLTNLRDAHERLGALLTLAEPASDEDATPEGAGAATKALEPALATLRDLTNRRKEMQS